MPYRPEDKKDDARDIWEKVSDAIKPGDNGTNFNRNSAIGAVVGGLAANRLYKGLGRAPRFLGTGQGAAIGALAGGGLLSAAEVEMRGKKKKDKSSRNRK